MAQRLTHPCNWSGCPKLVRTRFCLKHEQEHTRTMERERPGARERGYGRAWRALRRLILVRDPICKLCRKQPSSDVDHIIPRRRGGSDSPKNLQGTCKSCHSRKTATKDTKRLRGSWAGSAVRTEREKEKEQPTTIVRARLMDTHAEQRKKGARSATSLP